MTVKLPQKAGFAPTVQEWDQLVSIAENLAAQLAQRDAALRQMQAELDAAQSSAGFWGRSCAKIMAERDAARAEAARLTAALKEYGWHLDRCPAADCSTTKCECGYAALRQPGPAGGEARP